MTTFKDDAFTVPAQVADFYASAFDDLLAALRRVERSEGAHAALAYARERLDAYRKMTELLSDANPTKLVK